MLPVQRRDGTPAVLKLQLLDEESAGEPVALRMWNGDGLSDSSLTTSQLARCS